MTYLETQRLIIDAEAAKRDGNEELSRRLFLNAGRAQLKFALSTSEHQIVTRSAAGFSALCCFYRARADDEVIAAAIAIQKLKIHPDYLRAIQSVARKVCDSGTEANDAR